MLSRVLIIVTALLMFANFSYSADTSALKPPPGQSVAIVEFVGAVSEAQAGDLMDRCAAFVFCAEDDFGIAPLEANAHGAPVVALRAGAIIETMLDGHTAILFDEPTTQALTTAVHRATDHRWDESVLKSNAARFSPERFRTEFAAAVSDALSGECW